MRPTIETRGQRCQRDCARTFRHDHGDALPGGPFPGTFASAGDVRRCEHGRLWGYRITDWHGLNVIDEWGRITWWWEPVRYARAVHALRSTQPAPGERRTQP